YTLFKWSILAPSRIDIDWLYTTQDPYSGIAASAPVEPREPFSFLFHAYRPEQDIWQSYEKGLRDSFEKYVQIYKEHMLSQSSQEQRLTACKNKVPDHFRWLVWYQIPQSDEDKSVLECGEIANKIGRDSSTVSEAIKQSASIIDLKLRPSRMGRPPLDLDLP
ncbi:MAG TPA: hypothetical protein VEF04_19990, partial [Blastocatellia bacterium]|nr:hypothetical protein [Blastocatellia bacterium]